MPGFRKSRLGSKATHLQLIQKRQQVTSLATTLLKIETFKKSEINVFRPSTSRNIKCVAIQHKQKLHLDEVGEEVQENLAKLSQRQELRQKTLGSKKVSN